MPLYQFLITFLTSDSEILRGKNEEEEYKDSRQP